jgi:Fe-S cluster biogenesis protein NfuA
MTHEQSVQIIQQVLTTVRPIIMRDGGDIEFVAFDADNNVQVRLTGACVGCPSSIFTLKFGVEEALKAQLPTINEVVLVE